LAVTSICAHAHWLVAFSNLLLLGVTRATETVLFILINVQPRVQPMTTGGVGKGIVDRVSCMLEGSFGLSER
jgi:hypothetical protein